MRLIDTLFDQTVRGLSKTLDLTWRRNQAITANIANAETPLYRSVDLSFGKELNRAFGEEDTELLKSNAQHLDVTSHDRSHFVSDESGATKPDGNNVDIDIQMGRLAQNSGDYADAARLIKRQLGLIRTAIRAGDR